MIGRPALRGALKRGLVGLALLSVAACGSTAATPSPTTAPTAGATPVPTTVVPPSPTAVPTTEATPPPAVEQITFLQWVPGQEDQVAQFNASQSEIFVNAVNKGNGNKYVYPTLNTALQAGTNIPDVVQIGGESLPGFIQRGVLLNLNTLGAADIASQFAPFAWAQASTPAGVFAYPQDTGPLTLDCNKALLDKFGIKIPTTWDEFATAAAAIHKADDTVYLANFSDESYHIESLLWQAGVAPYTEIAPGEIKLDWASAPALKWAEYWQKLLDSGDLAPVGIWSNDWNSAFANQKLACWPTAPWGKSVIAGAAPDTAGQWVEAPMPQWTAGATANGNYGGSFIAITNASKHQAAAEKFARWLTTDKKINLELSDPAGKATLFPALLAILSDPTWLANTNAFFSGQQTNQIEAQAMAQVTPQWQFTPFNAFVDTVFSADLVKVHAGQMTLSDLLKDLQAKTTQYATDQGFKVVSP